MLSCKDPINIMASKIAVANNKKVHHSKSVRVLNNSKFDTNSKNSNYTQIKNPNYTVRGIVRKPPFFKRLFYRKIETQNVYNFLIHEKFRFLIRN